MPDFDVTLDEILRRSLRVLCVGEMTDLALRDALGRVAAITTTVTPGDGEVTTTPSKRTRPATNSFSAWIAAQDEDGRAEVGGLSLGRQAGRADVDLLRHRVYAHQRVFVEAGSPAFTWLLAFWDGVPPAMARYSPSPSRQSVS